MMAAPKAMHPILLHGPTMADMNVGGIAVETETLHQYSVIFCCCVMDGSRGAVQQNTVECYEAKVCQ